MIKKIEHLGSELVCEPLSFVEISRYPKIRLPRPRPRAKSRGRSPQVPAAGTWGDLPRDFARGRGRGKRILGYREISTKERGSQTSSEPRCSIFLIIRSGARRSQTFRLERGRSAGLSRF